MMTFSCWDLTKCLSQKKANCINIPVSLKYVNQVFHRLRANFHAIFLQNDNNTHEISEPLWPAITKN